MGNNMSTWTTIVHGYKIFGCGHGSGPGQIWTWTWTNLDRRSWSGFGPHPRSGPNFYLHERSWALSSTAPPPFFSPHQADVMAILQRADPALAALLGFYRQCVEAFEDLPLTHPILSCCNAPTKPMVDSDQGLQRRVPDWAAPDIFGKMLPALVVVNEAAGSRDIFPSQTFLEQRGRVRTL